MDEAVHHLISAAILASTTRSVDEAPRTFHADDGTRRLVRPMHRSRACLNEEVFPFAIDYYWQPVAVKAS